MKKVIQYVVYKISLIFSLFLILSLPMFALSPKEMICSNVRIICDDNVAIHCNEREKVAECITQASSTGKNLDSYVLSQILNKEISNPTIDSESNKQKYFSILNQLLNSKTDNFYTYNTIHKFIFPKWATEKLNVTLVALNRLPTNSTPSRQNDIRILNAALAIEHQVIAVYNESARKFSESSLKLAVKFLKQHEQHRDALVATINKLRGNPIAPLANYDVAKIAADFGIYSLSSEEDITKLTARLAAQTTKVYLDSIGNFENKDLNKASAYIAADEVAHNAILINSLGEYIDSKSYLGANLLTPTLDFKAALSWQEYTKTPFKTTNHNLYEIMLSTSAIGYSASLLLTHSDYEIPFNKSNGVNKYIDMVNTASDKDSIVKILNVALGLEHQAIAAYNAGAGTKLLSDSVLKLAVKFLKQHEQHRDALAATIKYFGGKPVDAFVNYDVAAIAAGVGVTPLSSEGDVIKLAARLEEQAAKAYLANILNFETRDTIKAATLISFDEVAHAAILSNTLGEYINSKSYLN